MPLLTPDDHGAIRYCRYCAPDGRLKSRKVVREGWVRAAMKMENISREKAEEKVDGVMPTMPAWRES